MRIIALIALLLATTLGSQAEPRVFEYIQVCKTLDAAMKTIEDRKANIRPNTDYAHRMAEKPKGKDPPCTPWTRYRAEVLKLEYSEDFFSESGQTYLFGVIRVWHGSDKKPEFVVWITMLEGFRI